MRAQERPLVTKRERERRRQERPLVTKRQGLCIGKRPLVNKRQVWKRVCVDKRARGSSLTPYESLSSWQLKGATQPILKVYNYKPPTNKPLHTCLSTNRLEGPEASAIARFVESSPAPIKLQRLTDSGKLGNQTILPPDTLGLSPRLLPDLSS